MGNNEEVREQKRMGATMLALAWVVLLGLGLFFFNDFLGNQHNPNQSVESRYGDDGAREIVLQRNISGHYVTSGKINGQPVTFMLDTGATGVAVPEAMAKRLQLPRGVAFPTQTANGMSTSYAVTLDSVSVGTIVLRDISAGIAPGLRSDEALLGMSFLKHIEFTQTGDTLILRQ